MLLIKTLITTKYSPYSKIPKENFAVNLFLKTVHLLIPIFFLSRKNIITVKFSFIKVPAFHATASEGLNMFTKHEISRIHIHPMVKLTYYASGETLCPRQNSAAYIPESWSELYSFYFKRMSQKEKELSSRGRETPSTSSDVDKVTEGIKNSCKITDSKKKGKESKHKQTGNEEASGGDRTTQPSKAKGTGKERSSQGRETPSTSPDSDDPSNEESQDSEDEDEEEEEDEERENEHTDNEEASGGDRKTQPSKAKGTGKERSSQGRETPSTSPDSDDPSNEEDEESQDSEDEDEEEEEDEERENEHTDNEASDGDRTPQQQKDKGTPKGSKTVNRQLFGDSLTDGEWLQDHSWERERPDRLNSKMADTVKMSKVYTVSKEWQRGKKNRVDLRKICSNLPKFVSEMKGLTSREELERLCDFRLYKTLVLLNEVVSPHIKEIVQKKMGVQPKDKPSLQKPGEKFMAYSLSKHHAHQFQPKPYWYLDCEYTLEMYLPKDSLQWFNIGNEKRIRKIERGKKHLRWVFIPSFRRAKIALLEWPQDSIITQESTLRILVVRPSEFKEYVQCCGHKFPVIRLPQDEIGAGYPRLWIQKIALRLKLDFIWMIDDSVECFYEYHPSEKPETSYTAERRRPFGCVFERIEKFVKDAKDVQQPIAAMSPKQFMGATLLKHPFVCAPPRTAVFLNIKAVKSKEVYYRPELQALEDMIFGYECEQNGLKVFIDNRVHLQDRKWTDTGARSPSVQQ